MSEVNTEHNCITVGEITETQKVLESEAPKSEKESARDFIYARAEGCEKCNRRLEKIFLN